MQRIMCSKKAVKVMAAVLAVVLTFVGTAKSQSANDFGPYSANSSLTGSNNTAYGFGAFTNATLGSFDTAVGASAMFYNDAGTFNSAFGSFALLMNTNGNYNTALGCLALGTNF